MFELRINGEKKITFNNEENAIKYAIAYSKKGYDAVVVDAVRYIAIYVNVA